MDPSFWLERWQQRQIGWQQETFNPHLLKHWNELGVAPQGSVFVPLCGKSKDMQWLHAQGHTVIGIELARSALEEYFHDIGLTPTVVAEGEYEVFQAPGYRLLCGDFFALESDRLKDIGGVFDRAALVALPANMRAAYVDKMNELVPARAPTLLVSVTYRQEEMKGPPFSVNEDEVRKLFADRAIEKLTDIEILDRPDNSRFVERGLTRLGEQVYRIRGR